ncbi:hypothetical protein JOM56_003046 [Amanita muscaria]
MVFSVTLNFRGGKSLTKKTNLVLIFDKQSMEGMYDVYSPVTWKVTAFPAGGGGSFKATYTANIAFTRVQISGDVVEDASYSTHINVQEETTLTVTDPDPPATYAFSKPEHWASAQPGQFQCHNKTGGYQDIGVGFYVPGHHDPVTALVVNKNPGGSVVVTFTPILSAYVVTGSWQKGKVIQHHIHSKLDWNLDLNWLPKHTNWILEESGAGYTLEIDDPPDLEAESDD